VSTFNAIGDPRLDQVLAKTLATPGGSSSPGIAPEIFPCITVESDRPEWGYLSGDLRFARHAAIAAGGAGTRSSVQLINSDPTGSTLIVVESVELIVAAVNAEIRSYHLPTGVLPFGTVLRGRCRDTRARTPTGGLRESNGVVVTDNTLAQVLLNILHAVPTQLSTQQPWVLGPGGVLYLCPSSDNVAITAANIYWRERRLNPSERL
jgi:hypothetical protein